MLTGLSMRRSLRRHLAKGKKLVSGHSCDRNCGERWESAVGVSYLQARKDRAVSWALRWAFRPRGGGERRHLLVRPWREEKKKVKGSNGKVDNRVEITKLTQPDGTCLSHQSHSLLLLRILAQAHISRIRLSLLPIFTSTASYPIYPIGPNTSSFQIPNILSAHLLRY